MKTISNSLHIAFLLTLISSFIVSCGGGGGSDADICVKSPSACFAQYGSVEGYVYVPIGSEPAARLALASSPQPGYKGLGKAGVTANCGTASKTTQTAEGTNAGYFKIEGLPTGNCTVAIKKTGYQDYQASVVVTANSTTTVGSAGTTLNPASSGTIQISVNIPGATIYVDGTNTKLQMTDTTYTMGNIAPGSHAVALNMEGFNPVATQTINVAAQSTGTASFMLVGKNNKIAFSSYRNSDFQNDERVLQLFTMNPDGTDQKQVGNVHGIRSSFSQDGTFILYNQALSAPDYDSNCIIFKVNVDGSNKTCILPKTAIGGMGNRISYDGKKIAFVAVPENCQAPPPGPEYYCSEIYIMDSDGNNIKRLTNNSVGDGYPSISPDGRKVVFSSTRESLTTVDCFIMDIDGTNEKRLTFDGKSDAPSFSPDGKKIVYQSNGAIYLMNVDGSNPSRLTNNVKPELRPKYSPDGNRIVYTVYIDAYYLQEIFIMDADGSNQKRLTFTQLGNDEPSWTP